MPADRRTCVPSWLEEKPVALSPITIPDSVNISAQCAHGREREEVNPLAPVSHRSKGCSMEHYHPHKTHISRACTYGGAEAYGISAAIAMPPGRRTEEGPVSMRQELLWVMLCW